MVDIVSNLRAVRERIAAAADRADRDPADVLLVAVSKTVSAGRVDEALAAGVSHLGESRVQEASEKIPLVSGDATWHFVGPLQSNKARMAALLFDAVQSVDRTELVERLARAAERRDEPLEVWVQVDMKSEATEAGRLEAARQLGHRIRDTRLRLAGLMAIPPWDPDPEAARPWFRQLRRIRDTLAGEAPELGALGLSMGMSNDFEVAVEEGATLVRVGTAIFGERG